MNDVSGHLKLIRIPASARASIRRESEEALDIGFVKEMSIPEKKLDIKFAIAESKSPSGKTGKICPKSSFFLQR